MNSHATFAARLARREAAEAINRTATRPPRIVTLLGGQEDEGTPHATNCTIAADTVNYKVGARGWKMTMSGAVSAQLRLDPVTVDQDPLVVKHVSAIGMWIHILDATKVTGVSIDLFQTDVGTAWNRSAANLDHVLVNGWNLLRWKANSGTVAADWLTIYRLRVLVTTNAATEVTLGHVFAEQTEKAKVLIVVDGCRRTFYENAYPALKARGVPVTWAANSNVMAGDPDDNAVTEAQLAQLGAENGNSIGFHSSVLAETVLTADMTAAQIREDTMRALKWLHARGHFPLWRAAWLQNTAPQHAAAQSLLVAYSTPSGSASSLDCWPPQFRYDVSRVAIHDLATAAVDAHFAALKLTHGMGVFYTHGVDDEGGAFDMTLTEWAYFLGKLDEGLAEGWLEGVTFEQLAARSGWATRQGFGDTILEFPDVDGTIVTRRLP